MSTLGSPFRSKTTTRVPSALNRSTIAAPMPAAPPGTMAELPLSGRILFLRWNYRRRFQLDLPGMVEEIRDEDHRHHRIVPAHQPAPDLAQLRPRRQIGRLVAAVGGEAADVLRPRAGLGEDGDDVLQRLLELRREALGLEHLLGVPADLAGDENQSAIGFDSIRVADGRLPALRMQDSHSVILGGSGSSSQPAAGCGTFFIHSRIRRACSASSAAICCAAPRTSGLWVDAAMRSKNSFARISQRNAISSAW